MRQLDPDTGKELGAVDITTVMEGMDTMSLGGLVADKAGTVFLADKSYVAAVDGQGQVLYTLEQADVYFAGDKSLDETVRLVQNRAQLYVNENR